MKYSIKLKSVNKISDIYLDFLSHLFKKLNLKYSIIKLPNFQKKFSLLKSPHVHKKAWEQFKFVVHKMLIVIKVPVKNNFLKFLFLNKPKTVKMQLKAISI